MNHSHPLALRLPHGIQEPAGSFASRLGGLNGCESLGDFCRDMGLLSSGVVRGNDHALVALETLGDLVPGTLARVTVRSIGSDYSLNGHDLKRYSVRRERVHVCPLCIAKDIANGVGPTFLRPHGRAAWRLASIRSCAQHAIALVPVTDIEPDFNARKLGSHDFPVLFRQTSVQMANLERHAANRRPSPLECYLHLRLWGQPMKVPLLDTMPWYAAAKICEVIGAASLGGPRVRLSRLSDEEWFDAGIEGFDILSGGEAGFWDHLEGLRVSADRSGRGQSLRAVYGRSYEWLAFHTSDSAFDPIREVIKRHSRETLPFRLHDRVFGATDGP
ncbi:MAG: hypothetical protein B7Z15_08200 [Rhizobiales bacterium 32-66-8]|nr:MAG: hypothetical protein B7Z15_08200 [Rhizobiales bacterium 32-66-8]